MSSGPFSLLPRRCRLTILFRLLTHLCREFPKYSMLPVWLGTIFMLPVFGGLNNTVSETRSMWRVKDHREGGGGGGGGVTGSFSGQEYLWTIKSFATT